MLHPIVRLVSSLERGLFKTCLTHPSKSKGQRLSKNYAGWAIARARTSGTKR
jgi:hypothetical protein